MDRDAVLSSCGLYRYWLKREWDGRDPQMVFIMLNPSTADALVDDATIRVCVGRAKRMGCGSIRVLNLFAYRATDPKAMMLAADPVGPENDAYIQSVMRSKPAMVIAAWGVGGNYMGRARKVSETCVAYGVPLHCLGTTKDGHPRHPLRIAYSVQPQLWR